MDNSTSVIIPAHNESATIATVLERLIRLDFADKIIVVDDGSTDDTASILRDFTQQFPDLVKVFHHEERSGKGAAIKTALSHVTQSITIIQDADLEYFPDDVPSLLKEFEDERVVAVYGSRILGNNPKSNNRFYWGGRVLSWTTTALYGTHITDEATGYKLIRSSVLRSLVLQSNGFEFCPEVTGKLLRRGHKIVERPIRYQPRSFTEGKKIRWYHGLTALSMLVSMRLSQNLNRFSSPIGTLLSILLLATTIAIAWSNNLHAPFVLDDLGSIRDNSSIAPPSSLAEILNPPASRGETAGGRPLLNLTFALNYQISALNPWSYHAVNICIHFLASLALFGLVRRVIWLWENREKQLTSSRTLIAATAAAIWAVHPLVTSAVSYTVQRAESLMALLYLITLYAAIRSIQSKRSWLWCGISVIACFLGTGVKEVIFTAPIAVFLLDYVFYPRKDTTTLLKNRYKLYFLLTLTWVPLFLLMASTGGRGGTTELGIGSESWDYLRTQAWAISHYLRLAIWPDPLVFDYGRQFAITEIAQWLPRSLLLLALLVSSIILLVKRKPAGFLIFIAFLVLAPTSSVIPIADSVFEHRFYLPLAAMCVGLAVGLYCISLRLGVLTALCLLPLGVLGVRERNKDYNDEIRLWESSLQAIPNNARGHNNLATIYLEKGEPQKAILHYEKALELVQDALTTHNLANTLALSGNAEAAIPKYREALSLNPKLHRARLGLADALLDQNETDSAIKAYQQFLEVNPDQTAVRRKLARAFETVGNLGNAVAEFEYIATNNPDDGQAYFDLGDALARSQKLAEAKTAFEKSVELEPKNAQALANLGNIHLMQKQVSQAADLYKRSLAIDPNALTHTNLAICYLFQKRDQEAKTQLQIAVQLDPSYLPARNLLQKLR